MPDRDEVSAIDGQVSVELGAVADELDENVCAWSERLLAALVHESSATGERTEIWSVIEKVLSGLGYISRAIEVDDSISGHAEYSPPGTIRPVGTAYVATHSTVESGSVDRGASPLLATTGPLLLFSHLDTEPAHAGWATPPLDLTKRERNAYGLGAADAKAGIVSILGALKLLQQRSRFPENPPVIVFAAAKQGGALGMLQAVESVRGVRGAVYCHPAESGEGLMQLKTASRGVATVRVTFHGRTPKPREERSPVSADPRTGLNPLKATMKFAALVRDFPSESTIWEVTGINGGGSTPFEVPCTARVDVACWFTEKDAEYWRAFVERKISDTDLSTILEGGKVSVELVGLRANPAGEISSSFIRSVSKIIGRVTGSEPEPYGWHSASDLRFPIRLLGVPTVGFGARGGGFYGPDEWVDLDSMNQVTEVLAEMLIDKDD